MPSNLQKSGFEQLLFLDYSAYSDCFSGYSVHLLQTTISTRSSVRQKNGHWLLTAKHAWVLHNGLTRLEDNSESVSMQKNSFQWLDAATGFCILIISFQYSYAHTPVLALPARSNPFLNTPPASVTLSSGSPCNTVNGELLHFNSDIHTSIHPYIVCVDFKMW